MINLPGWGKDVAVIVKTIQDVREAEGRLQKAKKEAAAEKAEALKKHHAENLAKLSGALTLLKERAGLWRVDQQEIANAHAVLAEGFDPEAPQRSEEAKERLKGLSSAMPSQLSEAVQETNKVLAAGATEIQSVSAEALALLQRATAKYDHEVQRLTKDMEGAHKLDRTNNEKFAIRGKMFEERSAVVRDALDCLADVSASVVDLYRAAGLLSNPRNLQLDTAEKALEAKIQLHAPRIR